MGTVIDFATHQRVFNRRVEEIMEKVWAEKIMEMIWAEKEKHPPQDSFVRFNRMALAMALKELRRRQSIRKLPRPRR